MNNFKYLDMSIHFVPPPLLNLTVVLPEISPLFVRCHHPQMFVVSVLVLVVTLRPLPPPLPVLDHPRHHPAPGLVRPQVLRHAKRGANIGKKSRVVQKSLMDKNICTLNFTKQKYFLPSSSPSQIYQTTCS